MKESKAKLVKRLEKIFAIEDKYFPGYLGNPQSMGAFVASLPRPRARSRRRKTPAAGAK